MTDKKPDGGPAFPMTVKLPDGAVVVEVGLTKRELFAAMAMQGLVASREWNTEPPKSIATRAALYADALIAEPGK